MKIALNTSVRANTANDGGHSHAKIEKAARDFESILIGQFFKMMHSTVSNEGIIKKSFPRKMYEEMMQDEFAKEFSNKGGFNLHKAILAKFEGVKIQDEPVVPGQLKLNRKHDWVKMKEKAVYRKVDSEPLKVDENSLKKER